MSDERAIEQKTDLVYELFRVRQDHPDLPRMIGDVLALAPRRTGMVLTLADHYEATGDVDRARSIIRNLIGQHDHQFINALRALRDLEQSQRNTAEAYRLGQQVLSEDPDADWWDVLELGKAEFFEVSPEAGWDRIDEAVALAAKKSPEAHATALGARALAFFETTAPVSRFAAAAEQALAADPTDISFATALGYAYMFNYRGDEAIELFKRVLAEDPTDEVARGGINTAKVLVRVAESDELEDGQFRAVGGGEMMWRTYQQHVLGIGKPEASLALDAVLPPDLAAALHPPHDGEDEVVGDREVLAWHDGQEPGTGALWGTGDAYRLMSNAEIAEMDEAIDADPETWSDWHAEGDYYSQILTNDADWYLVEGHGGRLYRRGGGQPIVEVAESIADWLWDRVVAFGGVDGRPGGRSRSALGSR